MTVPGELDRVPIKVVPIYLDPVVEEEVEAPAEAPEPAEPTPAQRPRASSRGRLAIVGPLALLGGVVTAVLTGVGVGTAASGLYDVGATLAWTAIAVSGASVVAGLAAIVFGWGRGWAIAGLVVAVAANPWVLTSLLGLFSAP